MLQCVSQFLPDTVSPDMAARPLTDTQWNGLPLLECQMDPGRFQLSMQVPRLIIRRDVGLNVEVCTESGHHASFRQAPLRFDLFGPGLDIQAVCDRVATRSLVVALPQAWMDDDGTGVVPALRPRFQFGDPALRRLVWCLSAYHERGAPLGAIYARAVSQAIVDRVVSLQLAWHREAPGLHPEARRLVMEIIDDELSESPTMRRLAARVGMSVASFARDFRATFKATPLQYVRQRRLQRAQQMLRGTDAALVTIALDLGFSSHAHFSASFHAFTGMTPSEYRRQATEPAPSAVASGHLGIH